MRGPQVIPTRSVSEGIANRILADASGYYKWTSLLPCAQSCVDPCKSLQLPIRRLFSFKAIASHHKWCVSVRQVVDRGKEG
jgi:hypothetical protein